MKLIDADALSRVMYHEAFETDTDMQRWDSGCWIRYKMFENVLDAAPSIDAVEVIRCRECKHLSLTTIGMDYACWHGADNIYGETGRDAGHTLCKRIESLDHYCSYGERSEP